MDNTGKQNTEIELDYEDARESFDGEMISGYFEEGRKEAEDILKDVDKTERFLQKLENKLKTVPAAGDTLAFVPIMISLVRSYVKKEYTDIPAVSVVSTVVALIYFLSPVDIIPDGIPVLGYVDDAVVISGCIHLIKTDIEDYRLWRKEHGYELDDIPDYKEIEEESNKHKDFLNAFFKGKNSNKK